jgi:hypothetical protein
MLSKSGELILSTHCTASNIKITFAECEKCLIDLEQVTPKEESEILEFPTVGKQIQTYWRALKKWVAAGRPERSNEEVAKIHTNHCSQCDWYDVEAQRCKGCGCKVRPAGVATLNKIKMATEHCPKNLW